MGDGHELLIDRVEDLHIHTLNTIKLPPDTAVLYSDWDPEYAADPVLGPHWTTLQADGVSGQYRLHMGRVRLAGRICVPLSLMDKVIVATHTYAHPGIHKTHQLIDRKYIFQELDKGQPRKFSYTKLKEHIALQLGHCQVCQAVKGRKGLQPDTMHSYPIPEYPFSSISADFCKLDEVKQGAVVYDSVFVIVCRLTGYVMALPCSTTITSSELASLFLTRFVTFFGLPKEIFSDVDKIMHADFFSTFCQLSGIEEYRSPVYRKKSNGRAERAVQVVVDSLRKLLQQAGRNRKWTDLLPLALWCANDMPGAVSGFSPHRLVFGRDPIGFGDHPPMAPDYGSEDAYQFFQRVRREREYVSAKLTKIHDEFSAKYLTEHPPLNFEPGDRVWLKTIRKPGESKLDRLWVGPAEILERLSAGRYRIAGP